MPLRQIVSPMPGSSPAIGNILAGDAAADACFALNESFYYGEMQGQVGMAAAKEMSGFIIVAGWIIFAAIIVSHFIGLRPNRAGT